MGLYKRCDHRGRARDRCDHAWWGTFHEQRVSLADWAGRSVRSKVQAQAALDELRSTIRGGTFGRVGLQAPAPTLALCFREFAALYAERYVRAKGLPGAAHIDYRLKPLIAHFSDRLLSEIKTGDVEDFVTELKKWRAVNRQKGRALKPASINRVRQEMRARAVTEQYVRLKCVVEMVFDPDAVFYRRFLFDSDCRYLFESKARLSVTSV